MRWGLLALFLAVGGTAKADLCTQIDYLSRQAGPELQDIAHAPLAPAAPDPDPQVVPDPWLYGPAHYDFGGGYTCVFSQLPGSDPIEKLECKIKPGAKGWRGTDVPACVAATETWDDDGDRPLVLEKNPDYATVYTYLRRNAPGSLLVMTRPDGIIALMEITTPDP